MARTTTKPVKQKAASPIEAFNALSDDEKERQTAAFDEEFVADRAKPLTPAQRKLWAKAKRRRPGRPQQGAGAKTISLTVEKILLAKADALAKRRKMSRAALVAESLRNELMKELEAKHGERARAEILASRSGAKRTTIATR
jgi:hypothetical protein